MRWDTIPPPVHDAGIIDVYLTVKDVTRPFLGISKSKWFLHFNGHITPSPIPCGQRYLVYGIRRPVSSHEPNQARKQKLVRTVRPRLLRLPIDSEPLAGVVSYSLQTHYLLSPP